MKDYKRDIPINVREGINYKIYCVGDLFKNGVAQEFASIIERECEKTIKEARVIWQATKNEEDSSLLSGLV